MFTVRCIKDSGWIYNYECDLYAREPHKDDGVITLNLHRGNFEAQDGHIQVHLSREHDGHYQDVFVMNSSGKTVEVIRAPR